MNVSSSINTFFFIFYMYGKMLLCDLNFFFFEEMSVFHFLVDFFERNKHKKISASRRTVFATYGTKYPQDGLKRENAYVCVC